MNYFKFNNLINNFNSLSVLFKVIYKVIVQLYLLY